MCVRASSHHSSLHVSGSLSTVSTKGISTAQVWTRYVQSSQRRKCACWMSSLMWVTRSFSPSLYCILSLFWKLPTQKQIALLLYLKISSLAYVTINLHSNAISQLLTNWVNDESYVSQWFRCCLSIKFFIHLVVSCGSWPTAISTARRSDDHARHQTPDTTSSQISSLSYLWRAFHIGHTYCELERVA